MSQRQWHSLTTWQVLEQLETSDVGLTTQQAQKRLLDYGYNQLPRAYRLSSWLRLLRQFHNLLIYVLLLSAAITAALQLWTDAIMITAVAIINAIIAFIQENKAESALSAIHKLSSPTAVVVRDGIRRTIAATHLVPGDIVLLKSGDRVPADMRLLHAKSLRLSEAILTGESEPIDKTDTTVSTDTVLSERRCMLYAATTVAYGTAKGIVVATASDTELGHIGRLLQGVPQLTTPLLKQLHIFTRYIIFLILGLAVFTLLYGCFVYHSSFTEVFSSAVALAVAAIPEGLPAVMSIILAVAVMRMIRQKAIVRRLPAIETLSSVTVICTDKTGTLTTNEMTVQTIITPIRTYQVSGSGYQPVGKISYQSHDIDPLTKPALRQLITIGALCNDAQLRQQKNEWLLHGDPVDGALLTLAHKAQFDLQTARQTCPSIDTIPFESEHRFMATLHRDHQHHYFIYVKGAPEAILALCSQAYPDMKVDLNYWHQAVDKITNTGQRAIAIAVKSLSSEQQQLDLSDLKTGYQIVGLVGCQDAPRAEAALAIRNCHKAGIAVKMVTGDHGSTAKAIAEQVGIPVSDGIMTGNDIDQLSDKDLLQAIQRINVFARTLPQHKLRLVQSLQSTGQTIAMTGDGVNDAPALKLANIGIAMGKNGSEVARQASEMVLIDDNFTTIERAIKEGRTVYQNLKKVLFFMLPTSVAEALMITLAIILGQTLPITPVQILWINMITSVTLGIAMAFEPPEDDVMSTPPRLPNEPLLSALLAWRVCFVGVIIVIAVFALFEWQLAQGASLVSARSVAVSALVFAEVAYVFNSRRIKKSVCNVEGLLGNRAVLIAVAVVIFFQLLITYIAVFHRFFGITTLDGQQWLAVIAVMLFIFLTVEFEKWLLKLWHLSHIK